MTRSHFPSIRCLLRLAAVSVSACALLLAASPSAQAAQPAAGDSGGLTVTRVIDRPNEKIPVPAEARSMTSTSEAVTAVGELPLPAGVTIKTGETVQVNYADGVGVYAALSDDCTVSATASTPKKTSLSYAYGTGQASVSDGCDGAVYGEARLYAEYFWLQDYRGSSVYPGTRVTWPVTKKCKGTASTRWNTTVAINGSGTIATSKKVTLACGYSQF